MKTPAVLASSVLLFSALVACTASPSGGPGDPADVGADFASLGIDDWPATFEPLDGVPDAPADIDPERYEQLTGAIAGFAEVATLDADLRELEDPIPELTSRLEDPFARLIPLVAEQETAPRVTLMNYFGNGVEVTAGPIVHHVWDVHPDPEGGTAIVLQSWAAYEVTSGGESGVIGVYREFSRIEREDGRTGAAWETSGANVCDLAVEDAMVLDRSEDQLAVLDAFVAEGDAHEYQQREVEETITDEFQASCLDEG